MGTISEKLTYLNNTKIALKDTINLTNANITNQTTFRDYSTKLYDGYINILKNRNILLDNMPKGTSTGYITNAADLPIYEDKMSKLSTQETTTGKNLYRVDDVEETTTNGVTYSIKNGVITLNGTATTGFNIKMSDYYSLDAGTYEFSTKIISGSYTGIIGKYIKYGSTNVVDGLKIEVTANRTISSNYNDLYSSLFIANGASMNNYQVIIQFETGDVATDVEPYTGGQASPNPSYPQEVKTVKGYRNLFDQNTLVPKKSIDSSTGEIIDFAGTAASEEYISVEPNKIYILSASRNVQILRVSEYASDKSHIKRVQSNTNVNYFTFTVSSNCYFIRISFSYDGGAMTQEKIDNVNFMLNEGTKELPYVPYGNNYIYTKILGKNLLNINYTETRQSVTVNILDGNNFTISGTSTAATTFIPKNFILPAGTYTLCMKYKSGTQNNQFIFNMLKANSSNNIAQITKTLNNYSNNTYATFTLSEETELKTNIYIGGSDRTFNINYEIQIINGNIADYNVEPYKEKIILLPLNNNEIVGLGNYKDELIIDKNGKCWLNKKTGKVILNGSENWEDRPNYTDADRFVLQNTIIPKLTVKSFSNYFLVKNGVYDNLYYLCLNNGQQILVNFSQKGTTTLSQFKEWLTTHNTDIYYPTLQENLIDLNYTVDATLFKDINNTYNSNDMDTEIKYIPLTID